MRAALSLLIGAICFGGSTPITGAQGQTRIFVAVHDTTGAPITDLAASDFLIRIDGTDRTILSVARATTPLSIVLLTDQLGLTSTYPLSDLRDGLAAFVGTLRAASPEARFALLTFDGSPRIRARFDASPAILDREIGRLVGVASNSVMLDGVHQASGLLAKGSTDRRAILSVFAAYRPDTSSLRTDEVGRALRQSGASLWSIEVVANTGSESSGAYASRPREVVISDGGVRSGGMRQTVTSRLQLAPALARVSQLLLSQYEIVYVQEGASATSERLVAVRRQNVTVLAPSWVRP